MSGVEFRIFCSNGQGYKISRVIRLDDKLWDYQVYVLMSYHTIIDEDSLSGVGYQAEHCLEIIKYLHHYSLQLISQENSKVRSMTVVEVADGGQKAEQITSLNSDLLNLLLHDNMMKRDLFEKPWQLLAFLYDNLPDLTS